LSKAVESGLSLSLDPEALDGPKAVEPCLSPFSAQHSSDPSILFIDPSILFTFGEPEKLKEAVNQLQNLLYAA